MNEPAEPEQYENEVLCLSQKYLAFPAAFVRIQPEMFAEAAQELRKMENIKLMESNGIFEVFEAAKIIISKFTADASLPNSAKTVFTELSLMMGTALVAHEPLARCMLLIMILHEEIVSDEQIVVVAELIVCCEQIVEAVGKVKSLCFC